MLRLNGFDEALIGMAAVWQKGEMGGASPVDTLVYNGEEIVDILMRESGPSEEESMEHISFNIEGAYVGEATPIIVWPSSIDRVQLILESEKELNNDTAD